MKKDSSDEKEVSRANYISYHFYIFNEDMKELFEILETSIINFHENSENDENFAEFIRTKMHCIETFMSSRIYTLTNEILSDFKKFREEEKEI